MSTPYWVYNSVGSRFGQFLTWTEAETFRTSLGLSGPIVQEA